VRLLTAAIGHFPSDHRRIPNLTRHPLIGMSGRHPLPARAGCGSRLFHSGKRRDSHTGEA